MVECKKINVNYTDGWIFGNPSASKHGQHPMIHVHQNDINSAIVKMEQRRLNFTDLDVKIIENLWLEVGKNESGKVRSTPQPIEDAINQCSLGIFGLKADKEIEYQKERKIMSSYFVPVIITNAPLYVSKYSLDNLDLIKGSIDKDKISLEEKVRCILVNYSINRSVSQDLYYRILNLDYRIEESNKLYKTPVFKVNDNYIVEIFRNFHVS